MCLSLLAAGHDPRNRMNVVTFDLSVTYNLYSAQCAKVTPPHSILDRASLSLTEPMLHHTELQSVSHSVTLRAVPLGRGQWQQPQWSSDIGNWLRCSGRTEADTKKKKPCWTRSRFGMCWWTPGVDAWDLGCFSDLFMSRHLFWTSWSVKNYIYKYI